MKKVQSFLAIGAAFFLLLGVTATAWPMAAKQGKQTLRISKEEVKAMLGQPDVTILDVRTRPEWNSTNLKIRGAIREEPDRVDSWAVKYDKHKTIILYCS